MANEIALTAALSGYKSAAMPDAVGDAINNLLVTMTGNPIIKGVMTVTTSAIVIPLGGVTSPGWGFFVNKDTTNFIRLMNGSGGAKVVKMLAGEPALFRFDDTGTPYAIADTASCLMSYLIFSL